MNDSIVLILFAGSTIGIIGWCVFVMDCVAEIKRDLKLRK